VRQPQSEGNSTAQARKISKKKAAPKGAAKFREETPRKGHGIAIKDRDTALQQYARMKPKSQALIFEKIRKTSIFSDT